MRIFIPVSDFIIMAISSYKSFRKYMKILCKSYRGGKISDNLPPAWGKISGMINSCPDGYLIILILRCITGAGE